MTRIISILFCLTAFVYADANAAASAVERADSAYNRKNYAEALQLYNAALSQEGASSNLYYNIANTYYRLGNTGHAVIFYRRALAFDPSNSDALSNLRFVKSHIANTPEDDSSFLGNLHNGIIRLVSPNTWAIITLVLFLITAGCVASYLFANNIALRKTGFFGAIVLFVITIYGIVLSADSADAADVHNSAVVIVPTANLSSTPGISGSKNDKVVPVPEGTELMVVDSIPTPDDPNSRMWYEVKLNNSSRAWVSASDIERI